MELNRDKLINDLASLMLPVVGSRGVDVLLSRASGQSLDEIGGRYGITRERIRQVETMAMWSAPVESIALLVQLATLTPEPKGIAIKKATDERQLMRAYVRSHPDQAHDYQLVHRRCGVKAPVTEELYGDDALMQLYRDYRLPKIGSEFHCTRCNTFKYKDQFNAKASNPDCYQLICRECNKLRQRAYWRDHYDKAIAYAKIRNKTPQARAYFKEYARKNKARINAVNRERTRNLTEEERQKRRDYARHRYYLAKLGLSGGTRATT